MACATPLISMLIALCFPRHGCELAASWLGVGSDKAGNSRKRKAARDACFVAPSSDLAKLLGIDRGGKRMKKRIAVVGAGAVGGYVGASLAHAGHDVTLIDPWPEHVEAIRANGMNLYGMTEAERRTVKVNAMHLTELQNLAKQRPIDIAFISMKSYDTIWATQMIRQYLSPGACVVSMQNCINEERVASVVGWGRTLGVI